MRIVLTSFFLLTIAASAAVAQDVPIVSDVGIKLVPEIENLTPTKREGTEKTRLMVYQNHAYVTYQSSDTSAGTTIFVFNSREQVLKRWQRPEISELTSIDVKKSDRSVTFVGKDGRSARMTWDELAVETASSKSSHRLESKPISRLGDSSSKSSEVTKPISRLGKSPKKPADVTSELGELRRRLERLDTKRKQLQSKSKRNGQDMQNTAHEIERKLRSSGKITGPEAKQLLFEIAGLMIGQGVNGIADAFGGSEDVEKKLNAQLRNNVRLLQMLRTKVAKHFRGPRPEQQAVLSAIDRSLEKYKQRGY